METVFVPKTSIGLQIMKEIKENLIITDFAYVLKTGMCQDEEEFETICDNYEEHPIYKEFKHIQKILAVQLSIFVLRRINGNYGECIDSLRDISKKLKVEYEEKFGKEFNDVNYGAN